MENKHHTHALSHGHAITLEFELKSWYSHIAEIVDAANYGDMDGLFPLTKLFLFFFYENSFYFLVLTSYFHFQETKISDICLV